MDLNSTSGMVDLLNVMLPLYCSEAAMKNENFKKGYELSQRLLDGFAKAEILSGSMIGRIFESYLNAADESEEPVVFANIMWCIFVWWTQIYDTDQILSLQNKQLSKKLTFKDYMKLRDTESSEIKEKRKRFISDFEEIITGVLKTLKVDIEWSDLADYYLALRYIVGMVDTDLSNEMNSSVGMQMMLSFKALGNGFAFKFCNTCLSA